MTELTSRTWTVHEQDGTLYFTVPSFEKTGLVRHGFSSRLGGFSKEPYGLNFGITGGDDPETLLCNYRKMAGILGCEAEDMVVSAQVHGTEVLRVGREDRGKGVTRPREITGIDGLITNEPDVCLVTIHADCVPVYLLDPVKKAIGLAHAGWRGTAAQIAALTVRRMQEEFGTEPADLIAAIGPSIGPDCFECGEELIPESEKTFGAEAERFFRKAETPGKYYGDLWEANRAALSGCGVRPERVTVTDLCTACRPDVFHSYRKTKTPGRMAAFLELKGAE